MATTKALWAQEAHLQPSEVPRVIPPHQNEQRSLRDTSNPPQTHTPPTPTHTHTHTYTHTHTHALSWGLVFTRPNSQEEGKGGAQAAALRGSLQIEEQHAGAQPDCPARAQAPAQPRRGLPRNRSALCSSSPSRRTLATEPPEAYCTTGGQVWAGASQAGGEEWEGKGEVQGVQSSWRSWRFANSELGTRWV